MMAPLGKATLACMLLCHKHNVGNATFPFGVAHLSVSSETVLIVIIQGSDIVIWRRKGVY